MTITDRRSLAQTHHDPFDDDEFFLSGAVSEYNVDADENLSFVEMRKDVKWRHNPKLYDYNLRAWNNWIASVRWRSA